MNISCHKLHFRHCRAGPQFEIRLAPEAIAASPSTAPVAEAGSAPAKSFGKMLSNAIAEVNQAQVQPAT